MMREQHERRVERDRAIRAYVAARAGEPGTAAPRAA